MKIAALYARVSGEQHRIARCAICLRTSGCRRPYRAVRLGDPGCPLHDTGIHRSHEQ